MTSHSEMITGLSNTQDLDEDNREMSKEADLFLNKRDGMWEPSIFNAWSARPRYTIDQVNPVLDGIMGEMDAMDFGISCTPNGGGATREMANTYAGIMRSIENLSKARYTYKQASRVMVGQGLAGWRVVQKERIGNPFVQDLVIEAIPNFRERVWFDEGSVERTNADAKEGWVLSSIPRAEYDAKYPKGSGLSVGDGNRSQAYYNRSQDNIILGEYYRQKLVKKQFVMMSTGKVYEKTAEFDSVVDDMVALGLQVLETREALQPVFYHQLFDGGDFLNDAVETAFNTIPLVPVYANWGITEHKTIYWGLIEKLMDPQRILNYSESKKVAESSLKPVEKVWITKDQMESPDVLESLASANVNADPHQPYDHVDGQAPPFKQPAMQPDTVLIETAQSSKQYIRDTSNFNEAARGVGLSGQSGETIDKLQNKGNIGNFKYFTAMEIAIGRTAEICTPAIPIVYDTPQEMMLINIDGTEESYKILDTVVDQATGREVVLNDLSVGNYQMSCSAGPAFQSKQQQVSKSMLAAANVVPAVMEMGADVFLRSLDNEAMGLVADRMRRQLLEAGKIPPEQMTEEELQYMEERMKNAQPDPMAQAQLGIAQAEIKKADAMTQDVFSKMEERQAKSQADMQKMIIDMNLKQEQLIQSRDANLIKMIEAQADVLNTQTDTLKKLRETMGEEAVVSGSVVKTFEDQVDIVDELQDNQQN